METLKLEHVQKIYKGAKKKEGDVIAVNDFNLSIEDNELTQICDSMKVGNYSNGEFIIREGEFGDVFYILIL